jgi:D-glycero-D-manno-heptose 1,7-bisphosphate phosphatase
MIRTLICTDRDGTLIFDEEKHLYLGRDDEWRSKVRILPHVIDGIRLLNKIPASAVYMITNQPGVAITDFPLLTEERAHEVCKYVIDVIRDGGGRIDGYFLCPHGDRAYVEKHREYHFEEKLICDCDCIKPRLRMVFDALRSEGVTREEAKVFVVGDRASDVKTALNIGGTGILVPFENQPGEEKKAERFADKSGIYIAPSFLDAARYISDHK